MALREQRHVQCVAALARLRETDLVAENGLSGAGGALDQIDTAFEDPATQNRIETRDAR